MNQHEEDRTHTRLRELLGPYVLGGLDADDRARLEAHLPTCAACRDELATYAGLPALLLWGEQDDRRDVAYRRRVAAALPGSSWVPVAGGGHLLPRKCPERVAEELDAFVAEIVETAASPSPN